jgi:hypothetical protein
MVHYTIYVKIYLKILSVNIIFNTFQGHIRKRKNNESITSIILEVLLGAWVLYRH